MLCNPLVLIALLPKGFGGVWRGDMSFVAARLPERLAASSARASPVVEPLRRRAGRKRGKNAVGEPVRRPEARRDGKKARSGTTLVARPRAAERYRRTVLEVKGNSCRAEFIRPRRCKRRTWSALRHRWRRKSSRTSPLLRFGGWRERRRAEFIRPRCHKRRTWSALGYRWLRKGSRTSPLLRFGGWRERRRAEFIRPRCRKRRAWSALGYRWRRKSSRTSPLLRFGGWREWP